MQYNVISENQSESITQTQMLRELDDDTGCVDKVNNNRKDQNIQLRVERFDLMKEIHWFERNCN